MAIDVYLQIEGIKGESADADFKGWIECVSANWGMSQPKSATASTGAGHSAERCEMTDISIIKVADVSSPQLMLSCASGRKIPRAKLNFMRADGSGERILYFEVELTTVIVGSVHPHIEPGNLLTEHVSLKFGKVIWKYAQQKIGGGSCGNSQGGWDLMGNRAC